MKRSTQTLMLALLVISLLVISGCGPKPPALSGSYFGQEPPGTTPKLFVPEMFGEVHSVCEFSPDGSEVYWSDASGHARYSKIQNGTWTKAAAPSFAQGYSDSPAFSPDGTKMYFLQLEDASTAREAMYVTERTSNGWSTPVKLPGVINSQQLHWHMSIAPNGDLYFGGGQDIYRAEQDNGQYVRATRLGDAVNSSVIDDSPFIARDGSYLLFTRATMGQVAGDLWVSFKNADGSWGEAVTFGASINTAEHELCPWVSNDGKYLFFVAMRNGKSQIYWVDASVIEAVRPK